MDLIYLFKSLMRRKWLIIISTLIAGAIAFVLTLNKEREFKAAAQMATGFTTSDQVKLKDENFNAYEVDLKFNNVIEAMTSPRVLSMVSYFTMLHDLESPDKAYRKLDADALKSEEYRAADKKKAVEILKKKYAEEKLLNSFIPEERKILELLKVYKYDLPSFRRKLMVARVQRTDFIDVQFLSENPELSAHIVNQLCEEFLRSNESTRAKQTVQSIETLEKLVSQKREELDAKLNNLRSMGTLDVSVESSSMMEQISNFENRLADERSNLNTAQLTLQQVNLQLSDMEKNNVRTASGGNNEIATLKAQMNAAYTEYVNKGSSDATLYKKYQDLRAEYKGKLSAMGPAPGANTITKADLLQKKAMLELQIKSSEQNITAYEAKVRQLNSSIGAVASRSATNLALRKELDLAQGEYENVKSRYDAAVNSRIVPLDNFRQILFGQPAVDPEPSKRLVIVALACVSMFIFCCVIIILLEYLDISIKTPSQFMKTVELKLLGVVNRINLKRTSLTDVFTAEQNKKKGWKNISFREHLRKLRFEIEKGPHKIFLFTSARKGEGKSTLIKGLAHSLSMSKKKVLIIDTNFTNNSLTREFEAHQELENFQLETGAVFSYESIKDLISATPIENVDIIGCKGGDYTPDEILNDNNLLTQLQQLTDTYDFILLEGPALNERSDSKELLRYADSMVSVVSARSSIKQSDKDSISFLQSMNGKFSGAVLNYVELENIDI